MGTKPRRTHLVELIFNIEKTSLGSSIASTSSIIIMAVENLDKFNFELFSVSSPTPGGRLGLFWRQVSVGDSLLD